jgi:putative sigma-54 modulation protein
MPAGPVPLFQALAAQGVEFVQIKISTRHGHLSEATQQFIRDKAEKLLKHFDRLTMIEVMVDLKDDLHKVVEIKVDAEHKHDFVAREDGGDILGAVEQVVHKLDTQIRRYKEKIQDHRRTPSTGEVSGQPAAEEASEE